MIPAIVALIRFARVPARIALRPSWAISERRSGAMPPSPPSRIPSELRFAKPVRAKLVIAAAFLGLTQVLDTEMRDIVTDLSEHATGMGPNQGFVRAIPAGVLVAAIVWMMASAQGNAFFIVVTFTWLIAAGDFTHVIAGSVEMGYLLVTGGMHLEAAIFDFFLPVLAGNVIGGTAIFSLLAWGQVRSEVEHGSGNGSGK